MREPWNLPAGWRWQRFDESARVVSQLVKPDGFPDLPHIAPNHIESQTGRLLPYATVRADGVISLKHLFEPGSVLYSKIRPYLAKVVVVDFRGLCSADMYPLESDVLEPRFLKWWMLHPEFTKLASGEQARTVLPKINRRALGQLPVPVPPRPVQRRIVELLEEHLSRVDAAAESLGEARRRTVLLHETWVLEILGVDGCSSRVIEGQLPDLPEGWRWRVLGDVAEVVGGITKDVKKESTPGFVEVPYLRVANVQRGHLDLNGVTTIRVAPDRASALALRTGDVLMNEGGDRDKLARGWIWESQIEGCIHQNHVFRARPGTNVRSEWLAWCANSYGSRWAQRHGRQTVNLASISLRTIKTMPIPVPPLEIQDERIGRIREALEAASRLRAQIEVGLERAAALRKSLLKAAFSGRLTATTNASWASEGFDAEKEVLAG